MSRDFLLGVRSGKPWFWLEQEMLLVKLGIANFRNTWSVPFSSVVVKTMGRLRLMQSVLEAWSWYCTRGWQTSVLYTMPASFLQFQIYSLSLFMQFQIYTSSTCVHP